MKRLRLLVLVAGALVVVLVLAVAVVFNSSFQTWIARRALASVPAIRVSVGSVSAGLKQVVFTDVRVHDDDYVLVLPAVEMDLPMMSAGWNKELPIRRLVATGWTLDLTEHPVAIPVPKPGQFQPPSGGENPSNEASSTSRSAPDQPFAGLFTKLKLPVDLSVDDIRLEGTVILPKSRGQVSVTVVGGGMSAGRNGRFTFTSSASLQDDRVKSVAMQGVVTAAMDTPRTFAGLTGTFDASATGAEFPQGIRIQAEVSAARSATGENYRLSLVTAGTEVIAVNATLPRDGIKFEGRWRADVRDADLAPFAFGTPLPEFHAAGEGEFQAGDRLGSIRTKGRLNATINRLEVLRPELATMGSLDIAVDVDLAAGDGGVAVQHLELALNAGQPVATLRSLQPFEINLATGELHTVDPARELVGLALHGMPVSWIQPFLSGIELLGGDLRGELAATARAGGVTVRAKSPLLVDAITVVANGRPLAERVDLVFNASADYTPQGWQAELSDVAAKSGGAALFTLDAKMGRLAGESQPLKATGRLNATLPALLAQPVMAGRALLTEGEATVDFTLSVNEKTEIQSTLALRRLVTSGDAAAVKLPDVSTALRADIAPDGKIAFNAPIKIERADRQSDVVMSGTIGPEKDHLRSIDAEVKSTQVFIEDAQVFAAMLPGKTGGPPSSSAAPRDQAPPWAGVHGKLGLQLKRVVYSDAVEINNLTGSVRIEAGMLKLETLQAGLGEGGRANVSGAVTFNAAVPQPYALMADVAVKEFDLGPLLSALTGNASATVEGRFDVTSRLAGRAASFSGLAEGAGGEFQLTSKGGVFRGLPVNVGNIVENTSKLASWIASAGTAISAVTGKKEYADVASKAEAVAEFARGLNPIPYDQLSLTMSRDAALNTTLRNFTLISPEVRLAGGGTALHKPGSSLLEDPIAMEFTLRARGRQGELLKYLGAIESQTDDLGYATCTLPLIVGGTIGKPDTTELNSKLTALAIEKSGFGDRAAEFLSKLRGGR